MRIVWNQAERRFQAVLTPGDSWSRDQEAVKKAGFKTSGPPDWVWFTTGVKALVKLKSGKPATGIQISPEGLENFKRLKIQEDSNDAIKAALKSAKQEQKSTELEKGFETGPEGFRIQKYDFRDSENYHRFIPPSPPSIHCHVCQTPVYFYELQEPPTCLDCEFDPGL